MLPPCTSRFSPAANEKMKAYCVRELDFKSWLFEAMCCRVRPVFLLVGDVSYLSNHATFSIFTSTHGVFCGIQDIGAGPLYLRQSQRGQQWNALRCSDILETEALAVTSLLLSVIETH
jgi:hypothetical protein